jgi:hypothetical protein
MKGTMMNNADTGLIVTTPEQLTDEQQQQILAALRERKHAAGAADRTIFLAGDAKVNNPTPTAAISSSLKPKVQSPGDLRHQPFPQL